MPQPQRDGVAEYSFDTSDAVDGVQSLKFIVHRVDEGPRRVPWQFQSRKAQPGATYAVTFW